MFTVFKNAWRLPELRKKLLYVVFMIVMFRLVSYIPVPGVDPSFILNDTLTSTSPILGLLDSITGGSLNNFTWMALGITPYINASIILQLLQIVVPSLEKLAKEGDEGRKKIAKYTRYFSVVLALIQALAIVISYSKSNIIDAAFSGSGLEILGYVVIVLSLVAGATFAMWMGERITEKGIGNGISLLIFAGIIAKFAIRIIGYFATINQDTAVKLWLLIPIIGGIILVIAAIVLIDMAYRRIPVQYAKKQVGRKVYGGQSTHIPMKIHASGVMPLIFAFSIANFPSLILGMFQNWWFYAWYERNLGLTSWIYPFALSAWIVFFAYFYNQFTFNATDVAKNLQQYAGFIPGIRPGKNTADYLKRILNRLTLFGSLFLAVLALLPTFLSRAMAASAATTASYLATAFSSTGLLIVVSVALELAKQLESQMLMRHYKGFLE